MITNDPRFTALADQLPIVFPPVFDDHDNDIAALLQALDTMMEVA